VPGAFVGAVRDPERRVARNQRGRTT